MKYRILPVLFIGIVCAFNGQCQAEDEKDLFRIGMIGLDILRERGVLAGSKK